MHNKGSGGRVIISGYKDEAKPGFYPDSFPGKFPLPAPLLLAGLASLTWPSICVLAVKWWWAMHTFVVQGRACMRFESSYLFMYLHGRYLDTQLKRTCPVLLWVWTNYHESIWNHTMETADLLFHRRIVPTLIGCSYLCRCQKKWVVNCWGN